MKMVCDSCLDKFDYDPEDVVRVARMHVTYCPSCGAEVVLPEDGVFDEILTEPETDELIKLEALEEEDEAVDYRVARNGH